MYFCVMSEKNIQAGETLVLGINSRGDLVCCLIDGTFVGFVSAKQPDGCLGFWEIASSVGRNRVLCKVAIKAGKVLIMQSDSKVFACRGLKRVEEQGYGMLIPA
ncbi:MAG: hypothetical protein PUH99_03950 [Firmicutes bacterium]|nr:hypothetical protein [Bacillota bacterium]MDY5531535.1 hypothetical protein [Pumilibacteraceae bacterium]